MHVHIDKRCVMSYDTTLQEVKIGIKNCYFSFAVSFTKVYLFHKRSQHCDTPSVCVKQSHNNQLFTSKTNQNAFDSITVIHACYSNHPLHMLPTYCPHSRF